MKRLILVLALLSAVALGGGAWAWATDDGGGDATDKKVTLCHFTGSDTNPFVVITISKHARDAHTRNHGDVPPDANGNCPPVDVKDPPPEDKVTICHRTGSDTNPFVIITISRQGAENHFRVHPEDTLFDGTNCDTGEKDPPADDPPPDPWEVCRLTDSDTFPYARFWVSASYIKTYLRQYGGYLVDSDDPCEETKPDDGSGKVTICHHTHSDTNPAVVISISRNAAAAHFANHGDFEITENDPFCPRQVK